MGYYANGSGTVVFHRALTNEEISKLRSALDNAWFEFDFTQHMTPGPGTHQGNIYTSVDFWQNEKYHGEDVEGVLNLMKDMASIAEGYINYTGEDGEHWRFIYLDNTWREQAGHIVYEDY